MSRLIYYSEVREIGPGGVQAILDTARRNNERTGVTGGLLFNRHYFLQAIEGDRTQVTTTFCKIALDRRHGNVTLASVHDIGHRDFLDWSMGYVASTVPELKLLLREFLPTEEFTPQLLSTDSIIALMKRIQQAQTSTVG